MSLTEQLLPGASQPKCHLHLSASHPGLEAKYSCSPTLSANQQTHAKEL